MLAGELDLPELVADHQLLDGRQRHGIHDGFDVVAVALVGGDATRGGMRMRQQSGGFKLGQDAADRGARDTQAVSLDERLRADGHRGGDVFLDDGPQDRLCAEVQGAEGANATRQSGLPTWLALYR